VTSLQTGNGLLVVETLHRDSVAGDCLDNLDQVHRHVNCIRCQGMQQQSMIPGQFGATYIQRHIEAVVAD
jgi:hypothetical protein